MATTTSKTDVVPAKPKKNKAAGYKFPKALGACADLLYDLKARRAAAQKVVDELEREEKALKAYLIDTLPASDASGVAGAVARVSITLKTTPTCNDWDAFWRGFRKGRDEDMLQRRLSTAAVEARWEAGKTVRGVEAFKYKDVSCVKV